MSEFGEGVERRDNVPPGNKVRIKVRMSLFFDGTLNNRRNSRLREQQPQVYRRTSGGDDSYENDLSNVARLEEQVDNSAAGYDHYIRVYTEGIGTTDLGRDSSIGYGLGVGPTGIESKVSKGIYTALDVLGKLPYKPVDTIIDLITIDTCGFSRGAAAARNCVYRALNDEYGQEGYLTSASVKSLLEGEGWTVGTVEVLAVGLFDTVSSHGVVYWNDVFELHLDAVRQAAAVYQLAAAEEYRENFSLTDITSAGSKGRQVYLPGAHSDIGGGYLDHASEDQTLVRGSRAADVRQFLLDRGWYHNGPGGNELEYDVQVHDDVYSGSVTVDERLTGRRASIARAYTFIPLGLMADFLKEHGVPVKAKLYAFYGPGAVPGRGRIEGDAKAGSPVRPDYWERIDPVLAQLRHDYLHVSFQAKLGLNVRTENVGSLLKPHYRPVRKVYHG